MRSKKAILPLISSLGANRFGLLLYEDSRRALCHIGDPALVDLLKTAAQRDRRGLPLPSAVFSVRLLGDLGAREIADRLLQLFAPKDPENFRLAIAEALLRLGDLRGERLLVDLLRTPSSSLMSQQKAAELLGWYGSADLISPFLESSCNRPGLEHTILCWNIALASSRQSTAATLEILDELIERIKDPTTKNNLMTYRPRAMVVKECGVDMGCYESQLEKKDWRAMEIATLMMSRMASMNDAAPEVAKKLARAYAGAHPQVRQAILVGLERMSIDPKTRLEIAPILRQKETSPDGAKIPPTIFSRAMCLGERFSRTGSR
jgi:hypothetical protein